MSHDLFDDAAAYAPPADPSRTPDSLLDEALALWADVSARGEAFATRALAPDDDALARAYLECADDLGDAGPAFAPAAHAAASEAVRLAPHSAEARLRLAETYAVAGDVDAAVAELERAAELASAAADAEKLLIAWCFLAEAALERRRPDEARRLLDLITASAMPPEARAEAGYFVSRLLERADERAV